MLQRRLADVLEHQVWFLPESHISLLVGVSNGVKLAHHLSHLKNPCRASSGDSIPPRNSYTSILPLTSRTISDKLTLHTVRDSQDLGRYPLSMHLLWLTPWENAMLFHPLMDCTIKTQQKKSVPRHTLFLTHVVLLMDICVHFLSMLWQIATHQFSDFKHFCRS